MPFPLLGGGGRIDRPISSPETRHGSGTGLPGCCRVPFHESFDGIREKHQQALGVYHCRCSNHMNARTNDICNDIENLKSCKATSLWAKHLHHFWPQPLPLLAKVASPVGPPLGSTFHCRSPYLLNFVDVGGLLLADSLETFSQHRRGTDTLVCLRLLADRHLAVKHERRRSTRV